MKKMILFICIMASFLSAQQNNMGTVSLIFNGDKIVLPINKTTIQKKKVILLRFEAEYKDSLLKQMVAIQIGLVELSSKDDPASETLEGTRIDIYTRDNRTDSGKDLSIWFDDNGPVNEYNKSDVAHYGIYNKGEKLSWEINTISMKMDITSIDYKNNALHIKGEISGTFKSTLAKDEQEAKIEQCKFEIIL